MAASRAPFLCPKLSEKSRSCFGAGAADSSPVGSGLFVMQQVCLTNLSRSQNQFAPVAAFIRKRLIRPFQSVQQ